MKQTLHKLGRMLFLAGILTSPYAAVTYGQIPIVQKSEMNQIPVVKPDQVLGNSSADKVLDNAAKSSRRNTRTIPITTVPQSATTPERETETKEPNSQRNENEGAGSGAVDIVGTGVPATGSEMRTLPVTSSRRTLAIKQPVVVEKDAQAAGAPIPIVQGARPRLPIIVRNEDSDVASESASSGRVIPILTPGKADVTAEVAASPSAPIGSPVPNLQPVVLPAFTPPSESQGLVSQEKTSSPLLIQSLDRLQAKEETRPRFATEYQTDGAREPVRQTSGVQIPVITPPGPDGNEQEPMTSWVARAQQNVKVVRSAPTILERASEAQAELGPIAARTQGPSRTSDGELISPMYGGQAAVPQGYLGPQGYLQPSMGDGSIPVIASPTSGISQRADECNGNCGNPTCTTCITIGMAGLGGKGRAGLAGWHRPLWRARPSLLGGIAPVAFEDCGYVCNASHYLQADMLYWRRSDGGVIGTNFGGPDDGDWHPGWRTTLGWRQDDIIGYELTYFGFVPMTQEVDQVSPAGQIDALFFPGGGLTSSMLDSFYDADETEQTLQTRLHSVDLSRVRFGWDVVKTSFGMRYIWLDDEYELASRSGTDIGLLRLQANNHLIGPHAGLELLYDVGRRISYSARVRGGAYLDFSRLDTNVAEGANQLVQNRHDSTDLAASLELGANAYFKLGRHMRLRGGYDALWLYDVLSVTENYPLVVSPFTGTDPDGSRNVDLHGFSFGLEIFR